MSTELRDLLELLRCVTLILEKVLEYFPQFAPMVQELEDEVVDRIQDYR